MARNPWTLEESALRDEAEVLAERASQGDAAAFAELAVRFERFLHARAREVVRRSILEYDDAFATAALGFVEAARRYDRAKGPFPPYLALWCRAMFDRARRASRVRGFVRVARDGFPGREPYPSGLADASLDPADLDDRLAMEDRLARLPAALAKLPPDLRAFAVARFGLDGRPPAGLAKAAGAARKTRHHDVGRVLEERLLVELRKALVA